MGCVCVVVVCLGVYISHTGSHRRNRTDCFTHTHLQNNVAFEIVRSSTRSSPTHHHHILLLIFFQRRF